MVKGALFLLMMLTGICSFAQSRRDESKNLQVKLNHYDAALKKRGGTVALKDSVMVTLLNDLAFSFIDGNPQKAAAFNRRALRLSESIQYKKGIAESYLFSGRIKNGDGSHKEAIKDVEYAIKLFGEMNNQNALAQGYNELAIIFTKLGNFPKAIEYNIASLRIAEKKKDLYTMATSRLNIGILYKQQQNYEKALAYYASSMDAMKGQTDLDANYVRAYCHNSMGQAYLKQGKNDMAMQNLLKAKEISKDFQDSYLEADLNLAIGNCFFAQGQIAKALETYLKALKLNQEIESKAGVSECYIDIGYAYFKLGQTDKAISNTKTGLEIAKAIGQTEFSKNGYRNLAEIYGSSGNYREAYENQKLFKQTNDSLFNLEKDKKLTEVQMNYEFEKKQASEKSLQQAKDEEAHLKDISQKNTTYFISFALLGVSILAFTVFKNLRRNQRQNKIIEAQKSELEVQNKRVQDSLTEKETLLREIHHRVKNNLQIISSLLNIQSEDIKDANVLLSIQEGQSRVEAMSLIHQNLYQSEHINNVDIENYLKELVVYLSKMFRGDSESVNVQIETKGLRFDIDTAIPLGLIVNELVSNAYKYAFDKNSSGNINIDIKALNETDYELNISNDGNPLPAEFDIKKSKSLGLKLVGILSRQLRGSFSSNDKNGLINFTVAFKDLKAWQAVN